MLRQEISITSVKEAKNFVNIASKYPDMHIYLQSGDYRMNGHSIMGVISLDMAHPITLEVTDDDIPSAFLEDIKPFALNK